MLHESVDQTDRAGNSQNPLVVSEATSPELLIEEFYPGILCPCIISHTLIKKGTSVWFLHMAIIKEERHLFMVIIKEE